MGSTSALLIVSVWCPQALERLGYLTDGHFLLDGVEVHPRTISITSPRRTLSSFGERHSKPFAHRLGIGLQAGLDLVVLILKYGHYVMSFVERTLCGGFRMEPLRSEETIRELVRTVRTAS